LHYYVCAAKASQLATGVRRAATVDLKAAILSVESAEKDMAAELTASKHRVSDTLRELGDLYEKRKEHWNRRREEVTAFIAAICDNHTKISAVEAQYAQQAEAATCHLREQVEAKVAEVEQDVEVSYWCSIAVLPSVLRSNLHWFALICYV
jgi:molybdopterin converting factor small subunit